MRIASSVPPSLRQYNSRTYFFSSSAPLGSVMRTERKTNGLGFSGNVVSGTICNMRRMHEGRGLRLFLDAFCVLLALFPSLALNVPLISSPFTRPLGPPTCICLDLLQASAQPQLSELRIHRSVRATCGKQSSTACLPVSTEPLREPRSGLVVILFAWSGDSSSLSLRHINGRAPPLG